MTLAIEAQTVISASGLTKHFGGVAALDDFSISVADREVRCIVGPNGAGKSTLFKVLAGLLKPDAGSVSILGRDVSRMTARNIARLGVATKLQIPRVFPTLTVREHLELASRVSMSVPQLLGLRRRREASAADALVSEVIQDMGLERTCDRLAQELSHGERQWLEIVMMLTTQPRLLLLDEPGAGMGTEDKARTAELIERLSKRMAVVVIEHDLAFVQLIAHNVMVLHRGRLLVEGSFDVISRDPDVRLVYIGASGT